MSQRCVNTNGSEELKCGANHKLAPRREIILGEIKDFRLDIPVSLIHSIMEQTIMAMLLQPVKYVVDVRIGVSSDDTGL